MSGRAGGRGKGGAREKQKGSRRGPSHFLHGVLSLKQLLETRSSYRVEQVSILEPG